MSDEAIPEDVMKAAKTATGGWMVARNDDSNAALVRSVARAILAERERAAKIADECAQVPDLHNFSHGLTRLEAERQSTALEIASSIRSSS